MNTIMEYLDTRMAELRDLYMASSTDFERSLYKMQFTELHRVREIIVIAFMNKEQSCSSTQTTSLRSFEMR